MGLCGQRGYDGGSTVSLLSPLLVGQVTSCSWTGQTPEIPYERDPGLGAILDSKLCSTINQCSQFIAWKS